MRTHYLSEGEGMATFTYNDKTYDVDEQKFLIKRDEWDKDFAIGMALELNMTGGLSTNHWKVINFIRNTFDETGETPLVYQVCKACGLTSKTLKKLFPTGYLRGACLLAGLSYQDRLINYYGEAAPKAPAATVKETPVKTYRIDVIGFLVDPNEWDEVYAWHRAQEMHIRLNDAHWRIIHSMRESYKATGMVPTIFEVCEKNGIELIEMENLFPLGYHRGAHKIAGLPSIFQKI